jgi:hypothetical protein
MKKFILSFVLIMFLSSIVFAYEQNLTTSYGSYGSQISVSSLKYEPYPVEPGETFKVYLILKNIGVDYAQDAACRVVDKYPFAAYKESQKNIGMLAPGREFLFDFEVKVDASALERTEELEVQCTGGTSVNAWNTYKIPIKIQYRYVILNIINVRTEPEILQIGQQGKVMFKLTNNAESTIKDVLVELDFLNSKLAPAQGITQKKIRNLNKNEGIGVDFDVYALPNAEAGMYTVPLKINYTNIQGEKQSFSTLITIKISETPSYYIIVESIEKQAGTTGVTLKFVNNGQADLQFFNVKILESKYIKLKSNNQIYIGDLDSDDYLTESFLADITRSKTIIPLEVTYKDPIGNSYKEYVNVTWDKSKIENKSKTSPWPLVLLILVGAGVGYYFYRKRKNKMK